MEAVERRRRTSYAEDWCLELDKAGSGARGHRRSICGQRAVDAIAYVTRPICPARTAPRSCSFPNVAMGKSSATDCLLPPLFTATIVSKLHLSRTPIGVLTYGAMLLLVECVASQSCRCRR